jgi:uncharacterized protein YqeY
MKIRRLRSKILTALGVWWSGAGSAPWCGRLAAGFARPPTNRIAASLGRNYRITRTLRVIADEVTEQMKVAMKAKDTARLATIRLIRSSFANAAIDLKVPQLKDEQAVAVLRKMAKMRADSIKMYTDGGALDRAEAERAELAIIESWLPTMADEDTMRRWVREAIAAVGADNVGKVMGALMKAHKAEVDGEMAQRLVKEEIAKAKP